jgi:hypothetical protein
MADFTIGAAGILFSLAAGALWWHASRLGVPANMDTFIGELQRISRWNSYAAVAACCAAICAAYGFARQLL